MVTLMFVAVPTPVVAFAARHHRAAAGIQITASHNPPSDNGYKVYFEGGFPIAPPIDEEVECGRELLTPTKSRVGPSHRPVSILIQRYVERAAQVRRTHGPVRVALTPLHGVGGEFAMDALVRAGFSDVHVVESQFAPDPDFPTVPSPNPEEPGVLDALLQFAADVDAEIAIALDPDADRCAVGVPTADGWRMLSGDETGWLLGDYILSQLEPGPSLRAPWWRAAWCRPACWPYRQGSWRPARRDADRVQVVVASRCRAARMHPRLCVRRGDRVLRRSRRGPRQGWHQRCRAGLRSGCRPAESGPHGARRTRRPRPASWCPHHDRGFAKHRRRRRGRSCDGAVAQHPARSTGRFRGDGHRPAA